MKTFLEVEGKMGPMPQPTSSQYRPPQPDTNPNVRKDNAVEKRRGQCPLRGLSLAQPPGLVEQLCTHLQLQKMDPHAWKMSQFMKALHDLMLERCQETSLRTETGCSLPNT